jgi:Cof subfamily protein (haloacid dehalogenase superfamily)
MKSLPFHKMLLVSDMDGTLLDSRNEISEKNRKAIERFMALGGRFTVATGRMEASVRPFLPSLPLNAPAILLNGSMIYDFHRERVLFQKWLTADVLPLLSMLQLSFPNLGIEVYADGHVYFVQQNHLTDKHQQKEGFAVRLASLQEIPKPWQKVILVGEPERLANLQQTLAKMEKGVHVVLSEPHFLELLPAGATKGDALRKLMNLLEIPPSSVLAIGDHLNDAEMLQVAGTGIAVANAHPKLKAIATFCGVDHNQHAVADVIQRIEHLKEGIR